MRITDISPEDLNLINENAKDLFEICFMFDSKISVTLWSVCNTSPVHAKVCLTNYIFSLGCITMEGGE